MAEGPSEREKELLARIEKLEAAATARSAAPGGGNAVQQIWTYFSTFIPWWIIAAGIGVFAAFYIFDFWNQAQLIDAETALAKARAALKDAQANAVNTPIGDLKAQIALATADVEKRRNEANRARVEAEAQNEDMEGETTRLRQVRADLANKVAQAGKARLAAQAAGAKFGLQTLADREAQAQLAFTELQAAQNRFQAASSDISDMVGPGANTANYYVRIVRSICENNRFAQQLNCPKGFWANASATPEATPDAQAPKFDCGKMKGGLALVVCESPSLMDAMARLTAAYEKQHGGMPLYKEQHDWFMRVGPDCGLPVKGRAGARQAREAEPCVKSAIEERIRVLNDR